MSLPPARPRAARTWSTSLIALWAFAALPLLALPVDWAVVCGCDACPLGGAACCCSAFPTFHNADGSPGKRASLALPSVAPDEGGCVGPAALSSGDLRSWPPAPRARAAAAPRGAIAALRPDFRPPHRAAAPLPLLPRPPPVMDLPSPS